VIAVDVEADEDNGTGSGVDAWIVIMSASWSPRFGVADK
jgi:hypothetical protein